MPTGVVTFVLTDVAGSTRLWEADRDPTARAISPHLEIIDEAVADRGGARPIEQGEGDSTVSALARASDAVGAALDIQRMSSQNSASDRAASWPPRQPTGALSLSSGAFGGGADMETLCEP